MGLAFNLAIWGKFVLGYSDFELIFGAKWRG